MYPKLKLVLSGVLILIILPLHSQALFEETAQTIGLQFEYKEALKMGGGIASFDYDNDGDEDLYVVGGENPDGLFQNDGAGNFTPVSFETNVELLTSELMTTSVVTGDIDNDGYREIFIGTLGSIGSSIEEVQSNIFLKYNPITEQYIDITSTALPPHQSFCMGGHFFDVNLDGYLDLYVMNYVKEPSIIQEGSEIVGFDHVCYKNNLFVNNGDGTFLDLSTSYDLEQVGCTLAATSSDLDGDNDPDLIVANDFGKWLTPNQLFLNDQSNSTFEDISAVSNTNAQMYGMGIGVGDFDEDLDLDFYITNIGENFFFENLGEMNFTNIADDLNVQNSFTSSGLHATGWGAILEDFNNDSYLDIFVSNGYVYSAVDEDDPEQLDELYLGSSEFNFNRIGESCGINNLGPSRGAIQGDWNKDGLLDIITISNENLDDDLHSSIYYYKNISTPLNWIGFDLEGIQTNRDAFGAKAYLYTPERTFLREVRGGDSHASQNSSVVHFGLASINQVDSLVVVWPGGEENVYDNLELNTYNSITEKTISSTSNTEGIHPFNVYPNPAHQLINIDFNQNKTEQSELLILDATGAQTLKIDLKSTTNQIDVSSLHSGLYTLIIQTQKHTFCKKISIVTP